MSRRLLFLAISLTAISGQLNAQQSAHALNGEAIRALLIEAFQRAKALDIEFARAIPDSAMRWAPSPDVRDFSGQLIHAANSLFIARPLFNASPPSLGDSARYRNDKLALEQVIAGAYDWIIEKLRALPANELLEVGELFGQQKPKWKLCLYALDHAMWTRGQMVSYYRAHGLRPPRWQSAY